MGVVGLTTPSSAGGLGLGPLDLVLLLEESGKVALPEPLVETTAVAAPLLAELDDGRAEAVLRQIATGDAIVTTAFDDALVLDADVCDALLACRADRIELIDADKLHVERQASVDGARHLFAVRWNDRDAEVLAEGDRAGRLTARAFDRGALAASAQLVGLADHLLSVTVEYVQQREQFGAPIGSFQAIKHHLADALLALEFARPTVYNAAYSVAHDLDTATRDVSMAKATASDAARAVARRALQCHGAIAYTVEYDLHMWMKRVWALAGCWGDAPWHRRRVAERVLGPDPAD
jgi:alkylation response protein AidB-like acyl-CoA dehydrogenase